ncbi:MAG: hypothetical protein ACRDJ0_11775 [Actinomycetota bacterium]
MRTLPSAVRPSPPRALLALLLFAAGLVFAIPGPAYACSCAPPPPVEKAIEQSDAVFTGTVTASEPPTGDDIQSSVEPITYTFAVDRVVAGDVGSEVKVTTAAMEASCGIEFRKDTRYVVFATDSGGFLETSLCTRTEQINSTTGGSFEESPPGKSPSATEATPSDAALNPTSDSDEGTPVWPWVVGGGMVTAALGLLLARQRASG